ncbi:DNA polymerase III subunit beta [Candidatus Peribacteria bacterium RIFCSPHIGHO2_01_FULL_51_9]|nr:MAG: DNA polymerase III subunit beta [Candidatus Peribacteria bacterium RIFCSPHIGHO2_01_FULL_51_9]
MKFLCKTSDLLHALTLVSRAISTQQALPILGNILFQAEGRRCTVSATDLEFSIVTSLDAHIENEGSVTVPARAILNFAQYNSDTEVLIETIEGTQLRCVSDHAKTTIAGESATEYPAIPPIKKQTVFTLDGRSLFEALQLTTFTCARSTLRPVLSGVYLCAEKGELALVGTDSYRLSESKISIKGGDTSFSCIVPMKVLDELKGILSRQRGEEGTENKGKKEKVDIAETPSVSTAEIILSDQQIRIAIGNTQLFSRLIEGKFPDYHQIVPQKETTRALIPTRELVTSIKRMHYFAKEMNNNLTFTMKEGGVRVTTPQTQAGKDEAEIPADITGAGNKIALSSAYILDFLAHVDEDTVDMRVIDSMHPAVFRLLRSPHFLHLVMPLRLQEE